MNKGLILAVAATVSLAVAAARADEAIVTYKSLAPDAAFELARAAIDQCRKDGYQVAVAVVDRFGIPLVVLRDRFAGTLQLRVARNKAYTAATFGRDTSVLIRDGAISTALARQPNVMLQVGGLVIEAHGSVLGGVGVSGGSSGDKDEACAKAGLAAVRDKLDF